jgi:hypothetical protein
MAGSLNVEMNTDYFPQSFFPSKSQQRFPAVDSFEWRRLEGFEGCLGPEEVGMPHSPDTICFEKFTMLTTEPLLLDKNALSFDPNMFLNEKSQAIVDTEAEHDVFKYLESFHEGPGVTFQGTDGLRIDCTNQSTSPVPTSCSIAQLNSSPKRLKVKRVKSFSSETSEDTEATRPKKSKTSPVKPRSRQATSKFRGVSRCTKDGRWQARIRIEKSVVYLGRFPTEEQAAKCYDEAARKHHGAQAMLNFVTDEDMKVGRKSIFDKQSKSKH